jgi:ABC-type antimicrobial peptide transport system permease subunit
MIKSYIKIAWRNLIKDKQFTILNLLGLSTGLACTLLIFLWINDELYVDKFNEKDSRLYQILKTAPNSDGTVSTFDGAQGLLAEELAKAYPEIEYAVPVRKERQLGILSVDDKNIKASWQFAGKDLFNIFSYRLIEGNKNNPISDKYGVLISDKLAKKLFNTTSNLIGKTITWSPGGQFIGSYTISGVFEAPPSNATDQFDLVFNYSLYAEKEMGTMGDIENWGSNSVRTYLLLKKGTDIEKFSAKIKDFTKTKIKSIPNSEGLLKWEGDLLLQQYSDRYLYNRYDNGKITGGRIEYVNLFSIIAIFILVIACINFMNLSTAKAAGRMKEVGIRKVVGASRKLLVMQYIGESVLMSFIAIIIAIILVSLFLPSFKIITGKDISLDFNPGFILTLTGIALISGVIAGSYPALYLSGFKPVAVLKGKLKTSAGESFIRKGLVIFQFTISVILIVSVLVVYRQMKLVQTTNLGYSKDNVIKFTAEGKLHNNEETFINEVKKIPGVMNASGMNGNFVGQAGHGGGGIDWEGKDRNLGIEYYGVSGDYNFMEILGLKMAEGRTFSAQFGSDSNSVIFNQAAIAAMGIKDPVGKVVSLWGRKKQIIGIVTDYHFESMYKKVGPAFIEYDPENEFILLKLKAGSEQETISKLEKFYKDFNQGLTFDYKFLDDEYQAMYSSEQKVAILSRYFAAIAIIISCLGLFGLSAFTAQKRQKEIGIRKVVGATVSGIAIMLSKDFLKLVLLSILIAFPIAWIITHQWLQNFAYRINIGAGIFFIAAAAIIIVTLLTISFQSVKAAVLNPVKSLRAE